MSAVPPEARAGKSGAKRTRRGFLFVLMVVLVLVVWQRRWLTLNDITTGYTPAYPEIQSHVYAEPPATVRLAARNACASLPRWHLVDSKPDDLHAEVHTLLFDFIDDVTVQFEPVPANGLPGTRVVIRSHSRVGRGDFGENARHIQLLQSAMDARLR